MKAPATRRRGRAGPARPVRDGGSDGGGSSSPGIPFAPTQMDGATYSAPGAPVATIWDEARLKSESYRLQRAMLHRVQSTTGTGAGATMISLASFEPERTFVDSRPDFSILDAATVVAEISSCLSLNVTEIAKVVGVERPTVYVWMRGSSRPQQQNRDRLLWLYRLARKWLSHSSAPIGGLLREPGPDGRSLLDLLLNPATPVAEIVSRFEAIAREMRRRGKLRKPTLRDIAGARGMSAEPAPGHQDEIDMITGKRIDPE